MSEARILLVEDSLGIARALSRALMLSPGGTYRVTTCTSGEDALERLQADSYDLLITDLRLPGMDGLNLVTWARQNHPDTRSVLITAYGSPQVEERARRLVNAYLPKPFRLHDLIQIVHSILEAPAAPPPSLLEHETRPTEETAIVMPERESITHLMVLATDFDGTLALNGHVTSETWEMLRQAKTAGLFVILVTGRTLESFITEGPFNELCEAVVAENGAIVYFPRRDIVTFPFGRLTPAVLQRLDGLGVPLERGMAIVATTVPHDEAILDVLREVGGGATVEYNRGAVMVLPLGATKGTGLAYALRELGYSPHNVAACGDAENDRSLFEVAEYAAAVANAPPGIKALADVVLPFANGEGVRSLITDLLSGSVPAYRSRPHRQLTVGRDVNGEPIHIDPFALLDSNLGVFGASSSGKSWLAGLVAEELLKQGYQICVIDPEGDYRSLATGPHTLLLGGTPSPLPVVTDVINFLESGAVSIILDLSMLTIADHHGYILDLLRGLQALRKRRGRPHWFLLDEAQYYLTPEDHALTEALLDMSRTGGLGIVSYRPSQLASTFLGSIQQWLLTRLGLSEDLQAVHPFINKCSDCSELINELPELPLGQAYLCLGDVTQWLPPPEGIVRFQVGVRTVPHIRHLHKYLRAPLPAPKRFYFHDESGRYLGRAAANLWEFRQALNDVPLNTLQFHLIRGDYERWIRDVLRDEELSRRVRKLGGRNLYGDELRRALFETVANRYEELERLG